MQIQKVDDYLSEQQRAAIKHLCDGVGVNATAREVGVDPSTLRRWRKDPLFEAELSREISRSGIADRSERLRIATMAVRSRIDEDEGKVYSKKDTLAWLEYTAKETGQWNASQELTEIKKKLRTYRILLNLLKHEICDQCKIHVWNRLGDTETEQRHAMSDEEDDA